MFPETMGINTILLLIGITTTVVFAFVFFIEGVFRPGYNPVYHTVSELELGKRGWIQRSSFFLMGTGVFAFATGTGQILDSVAGALFLIIFGLGMIVSGVFVPDPIRGYPPGAPANPFARPSRQALIHHVTGPISFLAIFVACLILAGRLEGGWQLYTWVTAALGLVMTLWTGLAFRADALNTGLVQRGLLLVYWSWIVALGVHITDPAWIS